MEKKVNNMIRSCDVDLDENPGSCLYSELFKVSVKFSGVKGKRFIETKDQEDNTVDLEVKGMQRFSESDTLDLQKKLKAMETQLLNRLGKVLLPDGTLCLYMKSLDAADKWCGENPPTHDFVIEQPKLKLLVDAGGSQLKNIKAYNSKTLALLEAGSLNKVTLHEMSNLHFSFWKGIASLLVKINILSFHLKKPPQRRPEMSLVDKYLAWVEGELRQYEEELETTKVIVLHLMKKKFGLRWLGLGLVPHSWKGRYVKTVMMHRQKERYKWFHNVR